MSRPGINGLLKRHGLKISPTTIRCDERAQAFGKLRAIGWSLEEIGQSVGLSRERARQILQRLPEIPQKPQRVVDSPEDKLEQWKTKWKLRILQCASVDGCWMWNGSTHACNPKSPEFKYGNVSAQFTRYGYNLQFGTAHRLTYFLFNGPIGPGMTVDHTCHNPLCVNPSHLRLCTQQENSSNHSPEWREKQKAKRKEVAA